MPWKMGGLDKTARAANLETVDLQVQDDYFPPGDRSTLN